MKRLAEQTLYEILEVPVDAPPAEIEAAYERARSLYGPGSLATYALVTPEESALLTGRIEEAKITLLDPESRKSYDAALAARESLGRSNGARPAAVTLPPVIPAVQPPVPQMGDASPTALASAEPAVTGAGTAQSPVILTTPIEESAAALPPPIRLERELPTSTAMPVTGPRPPLPPAAPANVDVPLPDGGAWTGEALRRVREARGITIQQISERTKVTRHHIENIEADRFGALPAAVYLRGILLAVARELRLDGPKVARAYLERAAQGGAPR